MKASALIGAVCGLWLAAIGVVDARAAGKPGPKPPPPTYPPARVWQAMAPGTTTGRIYLFGGDNASGIATNDLWTFDTTSGQWTLLTPSSRTQSLYGRKLAGLSCGEGQCVLFGGLSTKVYAETWYFAESSGTGSTVTWGQVSCSKGGTCPLPRYAPMLAFDPVRHYHVAFGGTGSNSVTLGDTWTLGGNRWTRRLPGQSPSARSDGSAIFVPSHTSNTTPIGFDKVVIFGGIPVANGTSPAALCDLWAWNGSDWEFVATDAAGPKPCLVGAAMGWDASAARLVVTGGFKDAYLIEPNTDTWYLTFTGPGSATWSVASGTVCAPLRAARGAYEATSGTFVFFGGWDRSSVYDDTLVCP